MRFALFLAAAAAALVLPVSAGAANWTGVVIAKDQARHALVTASKGGKVRTVRARGAARYRLGQRLTLRARPLADGTFRSQTLRANGSARKALLRAVVVRNQRKAGRVLVSAGGTVFAVRTRSARSLASSRGPRPGDKISTTVTILGSGLQAGSLSVTGHIALLELEGRFVKFADGILDLEISRGVIVHVRVPSQTFTLPEFTPGEKLEIIVAVSADGTFMLISLQRDDEDDEGVDLDEDGEIEITGTLTSLSPATVQTSSGSGISCELPPGVDLAKLGFTTGSRAKMECEKVGERLVLKELKSNGHKFEADDDDEDDEDDEDEDEDDD